MNWFHTYTHFFNWAPDNETWATTRNSAIITVIHKTGKKNPTSYRPISLLNPDPKLLSSILTTRITTLIQLLLYQDQLDSLVKDLL